MPHTQEKAANTFHKETLSMNIVYKNIKSIINIYILKETMSKEFKERVTIMSY